MGTYTQATRPMRVESVLGEDELLLEHFSGGEGLSTPFHYTLRMLSKDASIPSAKMLRSGITVVFELPDGSERPLHGMVNRFTQLEQVDEELASYRAEVVPWFWFTTQTSDCRIFQNLTVPDIVEKVFKDNGYTDFKLKLAKKYPQREYCVQYRETHFNFVSRLLEEEGIFYFFEHTADKHTMVLTDDAKFVDPVPGSPSARMAPSGGGVTLDDDVVLECEYGHAVCSGTVTLRDFNYTQPTLKLESTLSGDHKGELYDYPGRFAARADGDRYARLRLEEREAKHITVIGASQCRQFVTGHRFDLEEHYRPDANGAYLLTQVQHDAHVGGYRAGDEPGFEYRNSFTAIPHSTPYRPPLRAEKPIVHGSQTAIVVGKSGEEITVDSLGRVKVQFHWDRTGQKDDKSSCWVRVSTLWAGKQWGFIQIPRIGQEVIVDFLEGDPDMPIITGRVYNADQMPPYALPANQTQSGFKTRSSKGGGADNFNEIRFEDKKGSEELYLHAEKDETHVVENDRNDDVGHDETTGIGNDQSLTVGNNQTIDVKKNRTEKVGGSEEITVSQNRTRSVGKNETLTIGDNRRTSIGKNENFSVGEKRTVEVGKDEEVSISENRKHTIGKKDQLSVGKELMITVADKITLTSGDASITMKKNGDITIKGKNISIEGSGKINVKASSDVAIKGSKVTQN